MITIHLSNQDAKRLLYYTISMIECTLERLEGIDEIVKHLDSIQAGKEGHIESNHRLRAHLNMFERILDQLERQIKK